jgi:hypothetical protein
LKNQPVEVLMTEEDKADLIKLSDG